MVVLKYRILAEMLLTQILRRVVRYLEKFHTFISQKSPGMKNIILFLPIIIIAFCSCKKEYPCECKSTSTNPGSSPSTTLNNTPKMKKKYAIQKCNEGDGTVSSMYYDINTNQVKSYSVTTECELV
jgi:hypothetical protein